MKRFWKSSDRLESRLRAMSSDPRDEFLRASVDGVRPRRRAASRRVGFAAALTALLVASIATMGGLGYASATYQAVKSPVQVISKVLSPSSASKTAAKPNKHGGSGDDQYGFTICHHPPGNPNNAHTLTVGSQNAVNAHLRNHAFDHTGPCTPADSHVAPPKH